METSLTQICRKCGVEKELGEFCKGVKFCRECKREYDKEYREKNEEHLSEIKRRYYQNNKELLCSKNRLWAITHPERYREYRKKWKAAHPENVSEQNKKHYQKYAEEMRARSKKWYSENRELARERNKARYSLEYAREWFAKNRERVRRNARAWSKNNREKGVIKSENRRARKLNGGTLTIVEWEGILETYHRTCLKCGSTERIEMDHVVPLSVGGKHTAENIQPLCKSCNSSKGAKIADYRPKD